MVELIAQGQRHVDEASFRDALARGEEADTTGSGLDRPNVFERKAGSHERRPSQARAAASIGGNAATRHATRGEAREKPRPGFKAPSYVSVRVASC
jgi:hypothetical protein